MARMASANQSNYCLYLQCPTAIMREREENRNSQVERMCYSAWTSPWGTPAGLCQALPSHSAGWAQAPVLLMLFADNIYLLQFVLLCGGTKQTPCSFPQDRSWRVPSDCFSEVSPVNFCWMYALSYMMSSLVFSLICAILAQWASSDDVSDLIRIC